MSRLADEGRGAARLVKQVVIWDAASIAVLAGAVYVAARTGVRIPGLQYLMPAASGTRPHPGTRTRAEVAALWAARCGE